MILNKRFLTIVLVVEYISVISMFMVNKGWLPWFLDSCLLDHHRICLLSLKRRLNRIKLHLMLVKLWTYLKFLWYYILVLDYNISILIFHSSAIWIIWVNVTFLARFTISWTFYIIKFHMSRIHIFAWSTLRILFCKIICLLFWNRVCFWMFCINPWLIFFLWFCTCDILK